MQNTELAQIVAQIKAQTAECWYLEDAEALLAQAEAAPVETVEDEVELLPLIAELQALCESGELSSKYIDRHLAWEETQQHLRSIGFSGV